MPLDEFLTIAEASPPLGLSSHPVPPLRRGQELSGWRRSGPVMGVPGEWLTISPPKMSARPTSGTARRDTFRSMSPDTWLRVGMRASPPPASPPCGRREPDQTTMPAWSWRHPPPNSRRSRTQLKNAGLVPLTLHAWRQADDKLSYSGVWHKTATGTSDTASFQNGLSEADLPGVVAQQAGSLIDLDLTAAPPPPSTKERAASALQVAEAALKAKPDDLNARFARASAYFQLGENQKAIDDLNAVIKKAPQTDRRLSVPCHRPRPAGSQGPGQGGSGAVPEGQRPPRARSSTWRSSWRRNWVREPTRRWRRWKRHSRNSPRIPDCTTMPPVPTPWHRRLLPGRTRRRVKSLSERALRLLRKAIENGYADYKHMQEDADLDPLRELPAFAEIMKAGHLDRSYAAVWTGDFRFEASPLLGLDPDRSPPAVPGTCGTGLSHGRPLGRPDFPRGTADHRLGLAPPGDHGRDQGPTGGTSSSGGGRPASHGESGVRSCPCCGTVPTPGCGASSSTGSTPWEPIPRLIAAELDRIDRQPPSPRPPRGSSSWMPSCSTPRPRCGGR